MNTELVDVKKRLPLYGYLLSMIKILGGKVRFVKLVMHLVLFMYFV